MTLPHVSLTDIKPYSATLSSSCHHLSPGTLQVHSPSFLLQCQSSLSARENYTACILEPSHFFPYNLLSMGYCSISHFSFFYITSFFLSPGLCNQSLVFKHVLIVPIFKKRKQKRVVRHHAFFQFPPTDSDFREVLTIPKFVFLHLLFLNHYCYLSYLPKAFTLHSTLLT